MDIKRFLEGFGKGTLLMLFVGGIMLYQTTSEFLVSLKPAISFADMLEEGTVLRPGDHVGGEVVYALDYFATESTYTRYSDGSRSGDRKAGRYYLIPTASGFVGLKSREQDVAALDTLSEETFTYLESGAEPSTQIYTEGIVQVMEGDEAGFFYRLPGVDGVYKGRDRCHGRALADPVQELYGHTDHVPHRRVPLPPDHLSPVPPV